jgi:hypothetical protein
MPLDVTTIIAGGALSALITKALDRNTTPGLPNLSAPGPNPSTTQTIAALHSPHVYPAQAPPQPAPIYLTPNPPPVQYTPIPNRPALLSDDTIANANIPAAMQGSSDADRWKQYALQYLAAEQVQGDYSGLRGDRTGTSPYAGPPVGLTTLKDGSLAFGTTTGLASAGIFGGGGVGSIAGVGSSGFAAAGTTAATVVPVIGIAIGAAISIYSIIAAHHAAAVRREQSLQAQLIPPANAALQVIENAVVYGNITPSQGQQALDQLHTDFIRRATGGPGGLEERNSSGNCNALCWTAHFLAAICMKKQNRYAQLI